VLVLMGAQKINSSSPAEDDGGAYPMEGAHEVLSWVEKKGVYGSFNTCECMDAPDA
jgi:hypothetical protein